MLSTEIQNGNLTFGIYLASVCHCSWEELKRPGLSSAVKPSCQECSTKLCPQMAGKWCYHG